MRGIPFVMTLTALSLGVGDVCADVIRVPDDYAGIQLAIDAAVDRDTVLVSPGTYYENINFRGKSIAVGSHFVVTGERSYINTTIIHGGLPTTDDSASCVTFCSGEDTAAVLEGFTITAGAGTNWVDPQSPQYTWRGGGGVFVFESSPTVRHNVILQNTVAMVAGVDGAQGGGFLTYGGNPRLLNNVITDNQAEYGCGVVVDYSGAVIRNNAICRNSGGEAYGGGGFWSIGNGEDPIIVENNTVADNVVTGSGSYGGRGGGMFVWYGEVTGRNNVIWGNTQSQGGQIAEVSGGTALTTYSDVQGGFNGEGNVNAEPLFVSPTYVVEQGSPTIDAGNPAPTYNDPDDPANPGQALWPSQGGLRNDMGCYGGPGSTILAAGSTDGEESPRGTAPRSQAIKNCRPNPIRGAATIEYVLPRSGSAVLSLYDVLGRHARTMVNRQQASGTHQISWDPDVLPAGKYLCRLVLDGEAVGAKGVLLAE